MLSSHPLDAIPIGIVYLFTVILLWLAIEAGYRLGNWVQKRWPDRAETGVGTVVGASLGLLAFMLAFVTGIAVNIFNSRLQLVISEANSIGTTYLRAGFLEEPFASQSRDLLREYLDTRLLALDLTQLEAAIARSEQIHAELWGLAESVADQDPTPISALYISALNEMIDIHTERLNMSLTVRVPITLILGVYLIAILTMMLIGLYGSYTGKRNLLALIGMVLLFSLAFLLIVDLDRSQQGLFQIPQKALLDLQNQIRVSP